MAEEKMELSFSQKLGGELEKITDALPKDFNRNRFVQNCLALCNDKPELAKINRANVVSGLIKGAVLGLDFYRKECYLIPYGSSVQFQTDYKGDIKVVKRWSTRPIKDIYAKVVREGDEFTEKIIDGQPSLDFKPVPFNGGQIVGAFAVVLYEDGGMEYETMSTKDIENVRRSYSKAANSKAWQSSWDEMAKKTVLRRLTKHISVDIDNAEAQKSWEDGGDADFSPNRVRAEKSDAIVDVFDDSVIESEAVVVGE